jgi:hypothetical protein
MPCEYSKIEFCTANFTDDDLFALAAETTLGSKFFSADNLKDEKNNEESSQEEYPLNKLEFFLRQPSPESNSPLILSSENMFSSPVENHDTPASCAKITPLFRREDITNKSSARPKEEPTKHVNHFDSLVAHYFATDSLPYSSDDTLPSLIIDIDGRITELNKVLNSLSILVEDCTTQYGGAMNKDVASFLAFITDIKHSMDEHSVFWKMRKSTVEDEVISCINDSMKCKLSRATTFGKNLRKD